MAQEADLAAHLRKAHFELGESVVAKLGVAHFNVSMHEDSLAFCEEAYTREDCRDIGVFGREFDILQKALTSFRIVANLPESAVSNVGPRIAVTPTEPCGLKGGKRMALFSSVSPSESGPDSRAVADIVVPFFKLNDHKESEYGNACVLAFANLSFEGAIPLSHAQTRVLARLITVMTIGSLTRWSYTMLTKR